MNLTWIVGVFIASLIESIINCYILQCETHDWIYLFGNLSCFKHGTQVQHLKPPYAHIYKERERKINVLFFFNWNKWAVFVFLCLIIKKKSLKEFYENNRENEKENIYIFEMEKENI